jgi:hypothetical protein
MHENAARALQYYEDLPRRSGRPELRLVDAEPRTRRRIEAEPIATADGDPVATHVDDPIAIEARPAMAEGRIREPRARREHRTAHAEPRRPRAERRPMPARPRPQPRRQPLAPPRPQAAAPRLAGRPDRVAMWAVLLGFFLTAVAAATGNG